jgi:hypothetical protein
MNKLALRYYYTDPLTAAWMAKHHLMSFDLSEDEFRGWATEIQLPVDRYYIHPDCVSMLAPRVGDIVWSIGPVGEPSYGLEIMNEAERENCKDYEVMVRAGIPFMRPEFSWD